MSAHLRFGDVEIDSAAFELRRGGALCPVEPQVFELLTYLARNAGRLVTKDELIENIWNGRIVSDATLASRIKSARRAIGDDGARQELIKTVHGRGVRFLGKIAPEPAAVAATDSAPAADVPGRPAIAVLPFQNVGGDPDQSFFADGVVEEITAALSRMRSLIVIARSSTLRYRDQPIDPARVRHELGVRYLVEGNVRRSGGAVRIGARLIDVTTGAQVWAGHHDGELERLFDLEDRIAQQIVAAIAPTIRSAEIERARRKRPDSLEAYDCVMRALPQVWALTREGNEEALRLTGQAIRLDPDYALAYALAAWSYFWQYVNDWSPSPAATRAEGLRMAREALRLDNDDPDVLAMVSAAEIALGHNLDSAAALIDKALALDPNSAWAWIRSGYLQVYRGDAERALQHFARAERLSPFDPLNFNRHVGVALAHFLERRYDLAVESATKALYERPNLPWAHRVLAAAHGLLGNHSQATAAAARVREINPAATIASILAVKPFLSEEIRARLAEGLRRAGISEGAPDAETARADSQPAIAVLPFVNMSGDPDQDYFSDGLTEDLIAALAHFRWFPVIARNSTFSYKGMNVEVKRIARELGAGYVLEGSVRRLGGQLRVAAQLIDGETGHHVWTERYDREADDIFALQDELARRIAGSIAPELERVEIHRTSRRRSSDLNAWHCYLRGMALLQRFTPEGNAQARAMFKQAIALDPEYSDAHTGLAVGHNRDLLLECAADRNESMAKAMTAARRAVALDPSSSLARGALSTAHQWRNERDLALAEARRAVELNPSDAQALHALGNKSDLAGDPAGISRMVQAQQLNPEDPDRHSHLCFLARAYVNARRYEAAEAAARAAIQRRPDYPHAHFILAVALGHLGQAAEARGALARCDELQPGFVAGRAALRPYASAAANAHLREGLQVAGLEEGAIAGAHDGAAAAPRPSIAVLPFAYIGGDVGKDYLADGLTEDIITDLSRVSGLFVVARNTAFTYRGKPIHIQRVAEELGVRYLLEGSLRAEGGQVRITAQLIDGKTGGHVWAERYDRSLNDILALQDEIAQSVAAALRIKLLPQELAAITSRATANPEAYQYYLMGRSYFLRTGWGQRAMHVARQLFVKAADIDPRYARAYAGIANCDSYLLCMGDAATSFETILANCARALELEPDLADAHAAKGLALFTAGRTAEGSVALEHAMRLAPDSFEAHFFAGRCRRAQGHYAEAAALFERAAELQPDDFRALGLAANSYRALGRLDEARSAAVRCIERIEAELAVHADDAKALAFGAAILAELGQTARGEDWADRATRIDPADLITNYNLACAWVALGKIEAGMARLEKMFEVPPSTRRLHLDWMKHDPALAPVHNHPRYQALVRYLEADPEPAPPHQRESRPAQSRSSPRP